MNAILDAEARSVAGPTDTIPTVFFFVRYRRMAIDGTLLRPSDTRANERAFGCSCNQQGKSAYALVRCEECGTKAVVGRKISRYDVSEVHGVSDWSDIPQ